MNLRNMIGLIVISLVLLSGCNTVESKTDTAQIQVTQVENTQAGAVKAIAAADKARKKAASVDSEWRDTGKILKKAKAALKKGDFKKAIKLANKAEHQGHAGYEQGYSQRELRMPAYFQSK